MPFRCLLYAIHWHKQSSPPQSQADFRHKSHQQAGSFLWEIRQARSHPHKPRHASLSGSRIQRESLLTTNNGRIKTPAALNNFYQTLQRDNLPALDNALHEVLADAVAKLAIIVVAQDEQIGLLARLDAANALAAANCVGRVERCAHQRLGGREAHTATCQGHHKGHRDAPAGAGVKVAAECDGEAKLVEHAAGGRVVAQAKAKGRGGHQRGDGIGIGLKCRKILVATGDHMIDRAGTKRGSGGRAAKAGELIEVSFEREALRFCGL
jgi:hypothetical protein